MADRGNLETILGAVGVLSVASLVGIITYRIIGSSRAETSHTTNRSPTAPNSPRTPRPFGEALDILYNDPTQRCEVLEHDILPLSFHDDGCKFMIQDSRLCDTLLGLFVSTVSPNNAKQRRLAGWILGNISFNHTGQTVLPMMDACGQGPFLQYIHDEIQRISQNSPSEIITQYDVRSPIQSPFLSMLQMLVNFSSHDQNLSLLVNSDSIDLVCEITAKILEEEDSEKFLLHLLRILVNSALAIQKLPTPRTTGQIHAQRTIQNTCHQVSNAPHSEEIAERLRVIDRALTEQPIPATSY